MWWFLAPGFGQSFDSSVRGKSGTCAFRSTLINDSRCASNVESSSQMEICAGMLLSQRTPSLEKEKDAVVQFLTHIQVFQTLLFAISTMHSLSLSLPFFDWISWFLLSFKKSCPLSVSVQFPKNSKKYGSFPQIRRPYLLPRLYWKLLSSLSLVWTDSKRK